MYYFQRLLAEATVRSLPYRVSADALEERRPLQR